MPKSVSRDRRLNFRCSGPEWANLEAFARGTQNPSVGSATRTAAVALGRHWRELERAYNACRADGGTPPSTHRLYQAVERLILACGGKE